MSDLAIRNVGIPAAVEVTSSTNSQRVAASLKRRYAAERRFKAYGVAAVCFALFCLATLLVTIVGTGSSAFLRTDIRLDVALPADVIDPQGTRDPEVLSTADYRTPVRQAIRDLLPAVQARADQRQLFDMVSSDAEFRVRQAVMQDPSLIGGRLAVLVPLSDDMDQLNKGHISAEVAEADRRVSDKQIAWFAELKERGLVETNFNTTLFTAGDSREPELAGLRSAMVGSFYTMLVTLLLAFPLGVMSAVYLEEFAPKNRWTQVIEVNINNLAAVPSIVFGLLGLAVVLQVFGVPRSAPLAGGIVLALMTLPIIIIAARAALKSVPPSIREAALGLGASPIQTVLNHVLPLAMPGVLTGTIIGMARALGETAPLLMIGMVAFIVDTPDSILHPSTVLPVQVYLWADSPERAFVERSSAAIMVLLGFLFLMNALAVLLRRRFERRW